MFKSYLQSHLPVVLVITALLFSCKKNSDKRTTYYRNGILVDYTTRQPIAGHKVYFVKRPFIFTSISPWNILQVDTSLSLKAIPVGTIDSAITDNSGKFSFPYPPASSSFIDYRSDLSNADSLVVSRPSFFFSAPMSPDSLFASKKNVLKINIHKTTTVYANDTVFQNINLFNSTVPFPYVPYTMYSMGQVGMADRTIVRPYPYNIYDKASIEWRYYRNGLQASHIDTINLQPASETVFSINYP